MPLPDIQLPPELPVWLAQTHENVEESIYGHVPMSTGASRTRRVRTAVLRRVKAQLALTDDQLLAFHSWHESTLRAGLLRFACPVQNFGEGLAWYDAQIVSWASEPDPRMLHNNVEAELLLRGEPSLDPPEQLTAGAIVQIALVGSAELVIETTAAALVVVELGGGQANSASALIEVALIGLVSTAPPEDDLLRVWMGLDATQGSYEDDDAHLAHLMGL